MLNRPLYEQEVSADRLMEYTRNIAQWERNSGSPEEMEAFRYIQAELDKLGARTKLCTHDAFISMPGAARLEVAGQEYPCRTHSLVPSTADTGLRRELVYAGSLAELTTELCQDRIVMLDGPADEEPLAAAQQSGAAGVVFSSGEYIHEMCISPVWGSPSHLSKPLLFQIPVVSVTAETGRRILKQLETGAAPTIMTAAVLSSWCRIPLLTAEITAPTPTEKFVMFSGHVDSWYFGAMDNGTANAAMMEICRIAANHRQDLSRNLRLVFFSGHSHGRYAGSSWYFDNRWEDIHRNCVVSINVDSLGGKGANEITRSTIMPEARKVAQDIIRNLTGEEFSGSRYGRFADQSFWGAGVSCAFASFSKQTHGTPKLGWWWHTTEDTLDKIDPANLLRDTRIFAAFVMRFLTSRILPLDFRETALEIQQILLDWQAKANGLFDLGEALLRSRQLVEQMQAFYSRIPDEPSAETESSVNETLWRLGRILVPLNYTQGCIYQNDPGLPLPPMPSLAAISDLAGTREDVRKELLVELVRKRNYVLHSLSQALSVLE